MLVMLAAAPAAQARAGDLVSSFGSHGVATLPNSTAWSLGIQPGGKLVLAGTNGANGDGLLARFLANGRLDAGFGPHGTGIVDDPAANSYQLTGIAIQRDGKIVVPEGAAIARYNANGALDMNFGNGGYASTGPLRGAIAVALEGNGDIVAAGQGNAYDFALERFTTNGVSNGYFHKQFDSGPNALSVATSLVVQPNGAVVASGYAGTYAQTSRLVLARILGAGLDASFGKGGAIVAQYGTGAQPYSAGDRVALQPNGRIVVVGAASNGYFQGAPGGAMLVARYTANGQPDRTFGSGGHELSSFGGYVYGVPLALGVQANGELVVAGTAAIPGFGEKVRRTESAVTARYLPSGALDPGFGRCGVTDHQFDPISIENGAVSRVRDLVIQRGGQITVAGDLFPPASSNQYNVFIARYVGGDTGAAYVPAGWTTTFGIRLPPPPPSTPSGISFGPGSAIKGDAALASAELGWQDYLTWAARIGIFFVPVAGEVAASVDALSIASTLVSAGAEKIASDPPARNFNSSVRRHPLHPPLVRSGSGVPSRVAAAVNAYDQASAQIASLEFAYLHAIERAQGAYLAHNTKWLHRQLKAALSFQKQLASAWRRLASQGAALERALRGTGLARLKLSRAQVARARRALKGHGLPGSIARTLRRLGLTKRDLRGIQRFALSHPMPRKLSLMALVGSKPVQRTFSGNASDLAQTAACGSG